MSNDIDAVNAVKTPILVRARIAPEQVKAELEVAGYALVQDYDFLPNQYFLIFAPATR
jgi:hypothetical protein